MLNDSTKGRFCDLSDSQGEGWQPAPLDINGWFGALAVGVVIMSACVAMHGKPCSGIVMLVNSND